MFGIWRDRRIGKFPPSLRWRQGKGEWPLLVCGISLLWKYFGVRHRLCMSRQLIQIAIEGKQAITVGHGLGAENTINDIKAMSRAQSQRADKFLLVVIRNPLIM